MCYSEHYAFIASSDHLALLLYVQSESQNSTAEIPTWFVTAIVAALTDDEREAFRHNRSEEQQRALARLAGATTKRPPAWLLRRLDGLPHPCAFVRAGVRPRARTTRTRRVRHTCRARGPRGPDDDEPELVPSLLARLRRGT